MTYIFAILCVIGIAIGQILFKTSASALSQSGSFFAIKPLTYLISALILYAITTVAWVWVLQKVELGRVYPLMALAFVLVPVGSYFFLGERFNYQYFFGVVLIMLGIILTVRS
ncbi:EamA family transporter [Thermodesulfobium sp. 4217-1]|uniref:EamA family transporter n=1 Tax=Thermodesulfobium sp. 4217-1 TaxID=3120013 RepID=UPI003221A534